MSIAGIILAAGESSRMMSPKALLKIGNSTFTEHIESILREQGIGPVFVIAGAHYDEIRRALASTKTLSILHNSRYKHGQVSSLKQGLRHLPAGATAVVVWPVDQPLVKPGTVKELVEAFLRDPKPVVIPSMQGNHGHPVLYGPEAIQSALNLRKDQTAKDLRDIYNDRILYVEVDDPGILIDIDTPEDYQKHLPTL